MCVHVCVCVCVCVCDRRALGERTCSWHCSHLVKDIMRTSLGIQWIRTCLSKKGHRFDCWSRKISHAREQLSPWATATEACAPRA